MSLERDRKQLIMDWYEIYYEDLYRFILFMIGDQQCCEDLVHDTFVRAHTAYERFHHQSNIKTWLFSIAKHLVIDEIRKRKRRRWFSAFANEREIPSTFNLEQHTENKETIIQLMGAIQQLKPDYRLVITLKKIEGYSTKEIAQILDWSEVKVRKTLSRAMQTLRKMNGFEGGEHVEQTF